MRKLVASLLSVAAVGAGGTALAACGGDEAEGLDVSRAAAATAEKGTARVTAKVTIEGAGVPLPVDVNASGVTSLTEPEGKLTFDFGSLLSLAGAPSGTSGKVEVRFKDGTLYAKPPKLDQLEVPGGKAWVALDLPQLATALGLPSKGLGKLFTIEPAAQLRALQAAKDLEEVGKEDVAGAETTHFRGTYRLSDFVKTLPAAEQREVEAAIEEVDELTAGAGGGAASGSLDDPVPADLWVDEDGVTRRLQSTTKLPAQGGQPAGSIKQTYELSDFGAPLDAAPPAAGDTYDATAAASQLLSSVATQGGAGTTTP